jgi:hypothetical protein
MLAQTVKHIASIKINFERTAQTKVLITLFLLIFPIFHINRQVKCNSDFYFWLLVPHTSARTAITLGQKLKKISFEILGDK